MLIAGHLLLETEPVTPSVAATEANGQRRCRLVPGMIRLRDGHIEEVMEGELSPRADYGGADYLISPGFIDTHLHLPQFDLIGAHGLPLLQWLGEVTFPSEIRWHDVDFARSMTIRAIQQLQSLGTTGICAYATVHHAATAAALRLASNAGLRGVVGQVLMDREAPSELCRSAGQSMEETARLLDQYPPGSRLAAAVTPRFAISCSADLLAQAGRLAGERGAVVQTHLAETIAECQWVAELFAGQSYVDCYDQAGLLGPRSILGHGIHLDEPSCRTLAARGASIAHCPVANAFLRSGAMQRQRLLDHAIGVSLGSDIGAGYERSMIRVARAMIETAASLGHPVPDAATAWHSITAGNADCLGWSDAGRLKLGAPADLVLIRPQIPWLTPPVDPLSRLMFAWDDRWIDRTILRGETVYHASR